MKSLWQVALSRSRAEKTVHMNGEIKEEHALLNLSACFTTPQGPCSMDKAGRGTQALCESGTVYIQGGHL